MPCYQSTNLPSGVTTTGRTSYTTEADCLQACKEGACCEGTTCTVKPQCQCQCATGRCCGPDLVEVRTGEFYPAYRVETKAACLARGGSWKCGSFGPQSIEGVLPSAVGKPVCPVNAGTPEPVFKGVGTTCADACRICPCTESVPIALDLTFSGFGLAFLTQTSRIDDLSGFETSIKNTLESISIRVPINAQQSLLLGVFKYEWSGGCYSQYPINASVEGIACTPDRCLSIAPKLVSSSSCEVSIYCNGTVGFNLSLATPTQCWDSIQGNRRGNAVSWIFLDSASSTVNVCGGSIGDFSFAAQTGVGAPSYSQWNSSSGYGLYKFTAGTIRFSAVYANPLP